ncbi:hypothetical protein ACFLXG_03175 [Chloroflexota bacterium]
MLKKSIVTALFVKAKSVEKQSDNKLGDKHRSNIIALKNRQITASLINRVITVRK